MKVYLASGSPRRRELLAQVGIAYEVIPSTYEEDNARSLPPAQLVEQQALGKVHAVTVPDTEYPIIGADTIVVQDNQVLGKPADAAEAAAMLTRLSGNMHQVITGVAIRYAGQEIVFHEVTEVHMYPFTEADIDEYVASGEPLDKAGAYGIQGLGAILVEGIRGSYTNVVGLPIESVYRQLKKVMNQALTL